MRGRTTLLVLASWLALVVAAWICLSIEDYRRFTNGERWDQHCQEAIDAAGAPSNGESYDRYCWPIWGVDGETMGIDNECLIAAQHVLNCYPGDGGMPTCFNTSDKVCRALFPRWW